MGGIDPEKKQVIEATIKGSFQCGPINSTVEINQEFFFNEGTVGYHLIIARKFLDDVKTLETLGTRLRDLLLMNRLKNNPNKTVYLNPHGQISVTPKPS